MSDLQDRVIAIVAEQLRVPAEKVSPASNMIEDLDADSLDIVDLTIAIEEAFSTDDREIEIDEDQAAELRTVQDVIDHLQGALAD